MYKILVYFSGPVGYTIFATLKILEKMLPIEIFAINDQSINSRQFYQEQKFVKIKKTWFYRDYLKSFHIPDLNYLKKIEKKFQLDFWHILQTDPNFFVFGDSRKNYFTELEIYSLVEDDCKLFEKIIDEVNPDFLMIHVGGQKHLTLLREMCRSVNIKILQLAPAKFGTRYQISSKYDTLDKFFKISKSSKNEELSDEYLNDVQKKLNMFGLKQKMVKSVRRNKISFVLGVIKNFSVIQKETESLYTNLKKTNVIGIYFTLLKNNVRRIVRKRFLDKNCVRKISKNERFFAYSLHFQPEFTTSFVAPFFTDQISIIRNIARSLPIDCFLYVKEHPSMGSYLYWRTINYYKKILEIPNVKLIHPEVDSLYFFKNASAVSTISGSACWEALTLKKSVLAFSNISEEVLESVNVITKLEELPQIVRSILKVGFIDYGCKEFFEQRFDETIDIAVPDFDQNLRDILYIKNTEISELSESKFEKLVTMNKEMYVIIAKEFCKKILQYER
jgi:hypothetical protein